MSKLLTTAKTLEHAVHKFCSINISLFMSSMTVILFVYVSVQINLTFTLKKLLNEVLEYKSLRLPVSTCESFRSTSKRNLSATSCFGFKSEMEWNLSGMKNAQKEQVYSGNRRPIRYVFHFEVFRSDSYPV